jgi:predicted O-methyltransferase YrrM
MLHGGLQAPGEKRMRPIDQKLIEELVSGFSHGVGWGYDPATGIGCQRESLKSLGFGWLFFSLAQITRARQILVIGSGRGFSVACFALGAEHNHDAKVILVDPGYTEWRVDGVATDVADGIWKHSSVVADHFSAKLNLRNIFYLGCRSDEALQQFCNEERKFDIILIDGDHGFNQTLNDIRNSWKVLGANGLILAHDAHCSTWPGVAAAVAMFQAEQSKAEVFTLPLYPGIALIQRRSPLITLRLSTKKENKMINRWRREAGVTERPNINDPTDLLVGRTCEYRRLGLFSIYQGDELIGGLARKFCVFTGEGPDNFLPDSGKPIEGILQYGAVIRPHYRGRGYWLLVILETLRLTGQEGYYVITARNPNDAGRPFQYRIVGHNQSYTAYHVSWRGELPAVAATVSRFAENRSLMARVLARLKVAIMGRSLRRFA